LFVVNEVQLVAIWCKWSPGQTRIFGVLNSFVIEMKSDGSRPPLSSDHNLAAQSVAYIRLMQSSCSTRRLVAENRHTDDEYRPDNK